MNEPPEHPTQEREQALADKLQEILQRVDRFAVLDSRSPDDILGYDDQGPPR